MIYRLNKLVMFFFILMLLLGGCQKVYQDLPFFNTYSYVEVVKVFDGDTILLDNGEKVRLIGLDCPEMYDSDKLSRDVLNTGQDRETIKKNGQKASHFTKNLVFKRTVQLEFDIERKDKYGRLLAYVWIKNPHLDIDLMNNSDIYVTGLRKNSADEMEPYIFLNATIIKAGYAIPMKVPPNARYAEMFLKLYKEAKENKRGLWQEDL